MLKQDIHGLSRLLLILLIAPASAIAQTLPATITWESPATGARITGEIRLTAKTDGPLPAVVYLKNLSTPRIGQEPDEPIISDLLKSGYLVLILDYAHHQKAVSPNLNADVLKLRQDIADSKRRTLLTDYKIDADHLFILMEGFRLKRDIEFARDGKRVLATDIAYPSQPSKPVPVLMEITCDNANRMGSFSLLFCKDTLLEGAQSAGFATAMVDHPVAPPYKGLDDPMPQCLDRMKDAVKKLRSMSNELGTSEKIGAIGFSRGGPFAAMLAADGTVDAALIHGNRYDYLNLLPNDPMLARFEKAWGPRASNERKWAEHGAAYYLTNSASPMFLNTSDSESPEYRDGLAKFAEILHQRGIEYTYVVDHDGRGHRVSMDPKTLAKIYEFFMKSLH